MIKPVHDKTQASQTLGCIRKACPRPIRFQQTENGPGEAGLATLGTGSAGFGNLGAVIIAGASVREAGSSAGTDEIANSMAGSVLFSATSICQGSSHTGGGGTSNGSA